MTVGSVVIVEPKTDTREYLTGILQAAGYIVRGVTNGIEALMLIQSQNPTILILGSNLPEMSESEICSIVKQDPATKEIHVFTLAEQGLDSNAIPDSEGQIPIPIDPKQVVQLLAGTTPWTFPKAEGISARELWKSSDFLPMLLTMYRAPRTGVLKVKFGGLEKTFFIKNRTVVFFESFTKEEGIVPFLHQRKLIDSIPSEQDPAVALAVLISRNKLNVEALRKAYGELMMIALTSVSLWPSFDAEFRTAAIENDDLGAVQLSELLLKHTQEIMEYDLICKDLPEKFQIVVGPELAGIVSNLNLKPEESFMVSRFEGSRHLTIGTLCALTGFPEEKIIRFVYLLEKIGAIQFEVVQPVKPAAPQKAATKKKASKEPPKLASSSGEWLKEMSVRMEVLKSDKRVEMESHRKKAEDLFELAQTKFNEGDYWKASELAKEATEHNPEAKYFHLMALAYAQHPRFLRDADQGFHKAMELDPWNADYCVDAAEFLAKQGLLLRALNECKKALELAPGHSAAQALYNELKSKQK